ncbi:MAG: DMT family transporter [Rhodobacteraceae bacterium]|nr:DMT family transporter [Paracoccaceae bacterium]
MFTPKPQNPALAAILILCASAFIAASTLFAKALGTGQMGPPIHALQISQARFMFAFIIMGSAVLIMRPKLTRVHWGLHIGRTTCGWIGSTLIFASVAYIPMADATAISFVNPVFAMILAIPILGEKVGPIRWLAAAIALTGALILLRPNPDSFHPAALLALAAAFIIGIELMFMKKLAGAERVLQILFINNLIGLAIASFAAQPFWQIPTDIQWVGLAGVGISMACAQVFFINGIARADASFVAPFSYAVLVFAAVYDFAVFDAVPDWITILGAGVIVLGGLLLAVREARFRP